MNLRTYPLKNDDLRGCASCHAKSFPNAWSEEELKSFLEKDSVSGFAAKTSEKSNVLGFALGMECGERLEILTIAVDPEVRRNGAAANLLQSLENHCHSQGIIAIDIEVSANNSSAIRLYEKYGFKRQGIRKNYYKEESPTGYLRVDAILYRLHLTDYTNNLIDR